MADQSDNALMRITVEVSDDRQQAWIKLNDPDDPEPLTADEITAVLSDAKLEVTDAVRARAGDFLTMIEKEEDKTQRFLVAEGRPPVEGEDGEFKWDESFEKEAQDWLDGAPEDHYSRNSVITVDQDVPIGTVTPATKGTDGVDVRGNPLKPRNRGTDVQLDDATVKRSEDSPQTILAVVAGKVVFERGRLSIDEVLDIKGDVDFESGNVDASVNVSIKGTILDNFVVKSKKSIKIRGAIQAATVEAQEDVLVRGGILGRGKGTVRAGGQIIAKFAEEADLHAEGNVKLTKEAMNSRVYAGGSFLAPHGAVIGGDIYAREGAEVGSLGSDGDVVSKVTVGIHPDVIHESERITESLKTQKQAVERICEGVKPLMANLKRLTPAQKERATELLYQAQEMETQIKEAQANRDKMVEEARAEGVPFVLVSKMIHPGGRIRIGRRHVVFKNEFKGPVRIEKRKVENVTEFVAVNQLTGSITVLPSGYVFDEEPEEEQKTAGATSPEEVHES